MRNPAALVPLDNEILDLTRGSAGRHAPRGSAHDTRDRFVVEAHRMLPAPDARPRAVASLVTTDILERTRRQ